MSRITSTIRLSKVQLQDPPASMHTGHPIRHDKNHAKFLNFVMPRLHNASELRDERCVRLIDVDKQVYGWLRLSKEDQKRKQEMEDTGHPFALKQHMPLTLLQLEDRISYYSGIFAPNNGMFQHVGNPNEQQAGQKLLKLMNQHAQHAGYYKHLMRCILDLHKYQMGGLITEWDSDAGYSIQRVNGEIDMQPDIIWQGNRVQAVDFYNAFWPDGIHIGEIDLKAEFFGHVELTNYHEIQRKGASGEWLNVEDALATFKSKNKYQKVQMPTSMGYKMNYYRFPPEELHLGNDELSKRQGPWSFMSETGDHDLVTSKAGGLYELMKVWIWLNPYEHNLVPKNADNRRTRNRLELWKLEIIDGRWLVRATHVTNAHARIPVATGSLAIDSLEEWQRSTSEVMRPLQDFMSFLFNTHIDGTRESIWGLTIFNPEIVDMNQLPKGEVAGNIPSKPTAQDVDLSRAVYNVPRNRNTEDAFAGFQAVLSLMQQLMPNQAAPAQIAGIDRAVDRQIAAVIQGGNRPLQMKARLIDESILQKWRMIMFLNILQFQPDVDLVNEREEVESISAEDFDGLGLEYIIGQGLKAIDKQLVAQEFQRIIQAVLQSQEAAQQTNVMALIQAWSNYLDIEVDLTQFSRENQQQQAQEDAGAPGADAGADGIPNQA